MSGMKVKELMDSLKGDCYRFRVHYPEEWEFGLITGATFFGKRGLVMFGETLYGGDGRDWMIVGIAGKWSYDVYGLHVAHDGKKEKKPLRAEWLVHELTDVGKEVQKKDAANKEALS